MSGTIRRLVWSLPGLVLAGLATAGGNPANARQAELINMVRQDCGSCHGMTLKGGLGPALLPAALAAKDRASLTYTILYGRPGTPMPPWKDFVTEDEAAWIVDRLKDGFPDAR
jgi:cytochrome c55X